MDRKKIGYIVLAIAAAAILYTYSRPQEETETPPEESKEKKGIGNGISAGLGQITDIGKQLAEQAGTFIKNLLSQSEERRYSDLYNSWITNNNFKVSNGQGFGDFVNGKMKPAYWPELEQELTRYKRYVQNPNNFKPGTKARVIRRYQEASRNALRLVRLTIQEYTQNAN